MTQIQVPTVQRHCVCLSGEHRALKLRGRKLRFAQREKKGKKKKKGNERARVFCGCVHVTTNIRACMCQCTMTNHATNLCMCGHLWCVETSLRVLVLSYAAV